MRVDALQIAGTMAPLRSLFTSFVMVLLAITAILPFILESLAQHRLMEVCPHSGVRSVRKHWGRRWRQTLEVGYACVMWRTWKQVLLFRDAPGQFIPGTRITVKQ